MKQKNSFSFREGISKFDVFREKGLILGSVLESKYGGRISRYNISF